MFRPMRRKKKEISMDETIEILKEARRGILAVNGDEGYPYAIPVNYYYDAETNKIYFHGSRVGHKIDSLKKCDKVCFTVTGPEVVKEEAWAPYVKSAVVFGRCHLMEDTSLADTASADTSIAESRLRQLAMKYYPDEELVTQEINVSGRGVQMYEIQIEHISGKEIQEK